MSDLVQTHVPTSVSKCRHVDNSPVADAVSSDPDISSDDDKTLASTPTPGTNTALTSSTPQSACTEAWHELEVELLTPGDYTPKYDAGCEASGEHVAAQLTADMTVPRCGLNNLPVDCDVEVLHQVNPDSHGALVTPAQGVAANGQQSHKPSPVNMVTPPTVASTVATPCFSECSDIVDLTQT